MTNHLETITRARIGANHLEAIKLARIEGDELKVREAEIAFLREIIDSALRGTHNVELNYEPLEAWWPALATKRLRQLDVVVGR